MRVRFAWDLHDGTRLVLLQDDLDLVVGNSVTYLARARTVPAFQPFLQLLRMRLWTLERKLVGHPPSRSLTLAKPNPSINQNLGQLCTVGYADMVYSSTIEVHNLNFLGLSDVDGGAASNW